MDRLSALALDAQALADSVDPKAAFFGFLTHAVEEGAAKRDLIVAVMGSGLEQDEASMAVKDGLSDAIGVLLRRAQAAGAVRSDVTPETVLSLVGATCQATAHSTSAPACELLTIVCDGLRVQGPASDRT